MAIYVESVCLDFQIDKKSGWTGGVGDERIAVVGLRGTLDADKLGTYSTGLLINSKMVDKTGISGRLYVLELLSSSKMDSGRGFISNSQLGWSFSS